MATHTVLVPSYIGGALRKPGEPIEYADEPNWKFEPTHPAERAAWEATAADPLRVETALKDAHLWDYEAPPRDRLTGAERAAQTTNAEAYSRTLAATRQPARDPARYRELDEG